LICSRSDSRAEVQLQIQQQNRKPTQLCAKKKNLSNTNITTESMCYCKFFAHLTVIILHLLFSLQKHNLESSAFSGLFSKHLYVLHLHLLGSTFVLTVGVFVYSLMMEILDIF